MDSNDIGEGHLKPSLQEQTDYQSFNLSDVLEVIRDDIEMNPPNLPQAPNGFVDRQVGVSQPSSISQSSQVPPDSARIQQTAYVRIVEQPASKALRFRYECEGRSAGSIPGVNSTTENKTFPTIEIVGYKGRAVVVVSCVTKDAENGKYKPHPHNLVGKEGCKKGVCTLEVNSDTMRVVFSNLGIQCVKKKDIEAALKAREEIRVDPFITGYSHKLQPSSIDLNAVRLCFQVFIKSSSGKLNLPLKPVVSDIIYDKKAMSDLVISALCSCSSTVDGGKDIILLCEKVVKEDIEIRFFEEKTGWEAKGDFQHTDVHKQTAIKFRTPRYRTLDIDKPVQVSIQLRRPTDGVTSEPLQFDYLPLDTGKRTFWMMRRHLKRKPEVDIFQRILSEDSEANKLTLQEKDSEDSTAGTPFSVEDYQICVPPLKHSRSEEDDSYEEEIRNKEREVDKIVQEKMLEFEKAFNETDFNTNEVDTQTASSLLRKQSLIENKLRPLEQNDKISVWMKSSEFEQNNITISDSDPTESSSMSGRDNALNDLLDQVAELDEIYTDHILKRNTDANEITQIEDLNRKVNKIDSVDFDDAATYTSLQFAFKNPLPMSDIMPPTPPGSNSAPDDLTYDPIDISLTLAQTPVIEVSSVDKSEPLPPLPPKRVKKPQQQSFPSPTVTEINSNSSSVSNLSRPQSQIIIMKTPNHSPPSKKLPPTPSKIKSSASVNTLTRPKKQGFFSKLFSRKKSKTDLTNNENQMEQLSKDTSPCNSREPSIGNFNLNEANRCSFKSLQPNTNFSSNNSSPCKSPSKLNKSGGRPVGRSVSSVSGKRPNLQPDIIHIRLKGEDDYNNEAYSTASTLTLNHLDRKTVSALQLADIPITEGNMGLVAIADAQSLKNLCEGQYGVQLDPSVDLTEAEHFALYTAIPPQATTSEFDENSCYYAQVDAGEILTPSEIARRLTDANQ